MPHPRSAALQEITVEKLKMVLVDAKVVSGGP